MKRSFKDYALLALKGMGMGAADVVPGVSGGTIAFIVGIYDELIDSIKSINAQSLKMFFTGKWGTFWKMINGNFLLFLLAGIGISVFSLAKVITWLLTDHPVLVWSFFFGLVLASTWFVGKDIKEWNWKTILGFIVGVAVAFTLQSLLRQKLLLIYCLSFYVGLLRFVHDSSGDIGKFYIGIAGKILFYHGSSKDIRYKGYTCIRCWGMHWYNQFLTCLIVCIKAFS